MFSRLAVLAAVVAVASAGYYTSKPVCIKDGAKCHGAPGYPSVDHVSCCSKDYKCVDVTGWAGKAYGEKTGWGSHCLKVTYPKCNPVGTRCEGAKGYDMVLGAGCCDGAVCESVKGKWGKFCVAKKSYGYKAPAPVYKKPVYKEPVYKKPVYKEPVYKEPVYKEPVYKEPVYKKPVEKKCYAMGERCVGAPGKPYVKYLGCCKGTCTAKKSGYGEYGLYCEEKHYVKPSHGYGYEKKPDHKKCYKEGERCIGAKGKAYVEYYGDDKWDGCCDGYECTGKGSGYGAYGLYCEKPKPKKTY